MALLEDPIFNNRYQKYKYRVKVWESEFIKTTGRKPNKKDIKQADIKIKQAYKVYWNLKTQALENSLSDITFGDDSFFGNDSSSLDSSTFADTQLPNFDETTTDSILSGSILTDTNALDETSNLNKTVDLNETSNLNDDAHCGRSEMEVDQDGFKNVSGVWSRSLNKKLESDGRRSLSRKPSFQLSQKMFKSSSFVKRNPRKSLSTSKLPKPGEKEEKKDEVNESTNEKDISDEFFEAFDSIKYKIAEQDTSKPIVRGVEQLLSSQKICTKTLDQGWIQRCSTMTKDLKPASTPSNHVSDDEDFIYDSDEDTRPMKRVRNLRKHFSYGDLPEPKRICLDDHSKRQSEPLNDKIKDETLLKVLRENSENVERIVTQEELQTEVPESVPIPTVKVAEKQPENKTGKVSSVNKIQSSKAIVEKDENNEGVEKVEQKKPAVKRRVNQKVEEKDEYEWESEEEEEEDEPVKKRRGRPAAVKKGKTTRKPRATTTTKTTKRTTRQSKATKEDSEPNEDEDEEGEKVKNKRDDDLDVFDIDNVNTVARFAMNPMSTGSLVEDFSKVLRSTDNNSKSNKVSKNDLENTAIDKKIASGTLNDNFVRINLKKKVYARGKNNFNFSKFKKSQWKQRKKELDSSEANMAILDYKDKKGNNPTYCFKCNETGHFSKYCPNMKKDKLIPFEESEEIEIPSEFPTLEEAAQMARISKAATFSKLAPRNTVGENSEEDLEEWEEWENENPEESQNIKEICKVPTELIEKLLPPERNAVAPLYTPNPDLSTIETPPEVYETLHQFGYENFRPGQEQAIMRILSGVSTLVTLATGTGKSLCYQLPAYMFARKYNCITLVVSPLVSLMDDQVKGVCPILKAACLHTNQTEKVREEVISSVRKGKIDVLLVSPEAIVGGEKTSGFGAVIRDLPPIAFACIDEAHCISQWSHNFRPSYLMLCRVLKEKLKVKVILGLTATATKANAMNIVEHLGIPDGTAGVVTDRPLPDNLQLTISRDQNRDQALIALLKSDRLKNCQSILVYCTRREECVRIASFIRTVFQNEPRPEPRKGAPKKISPIVEAYHAGFSASQRKMVQKAFTLGDTRIIVATVAFGMGIDKPDIRCVIHYNMPSNFENYVQEIGRAGRDGLPAQCHLFLSSDPQADKIELRRHIFANSVERETIRKLLDRLFVPCSCITALQKSCGQRCAGHEVALPLNDTVEALDTNEEIISTLLCYLELHPKNYVTVLSNAYVTATVGTYGGSRPLKLAAQHSPPLAMAIAAGIKNGTYSETDSMIEFNVIEIASNIGWDSGIVKSHLKGLEWLTVNGVTKRSQLTVRFKDLGLRIRAPGDLSDAELDEALNTLYQRCKSQETSRLAQLNAICDTVRQFSFPTVEETSEMNDEVGLKSELFKQEIRKYFVEDAEILDAPYHEKLSAHTEASIRRDIRGLRSTYRETNFTGRAIARIFYGIQSPNYPASVWFRCRYWRSHLDVDFNCLCQLATKEVLGIQ